MTHNIDDHIQTCGGILQVKIDQELRNAVKIASSEFSREQKRQQEEEKNNSPWARADLLTTSREK